MKKLGFTLSELIIAISIIAISAALVVPIVSKFVPDTKKANVLKYNILINNAIIDLFNDKNNFSENNNCEGLSCYNWEDSSFADFSEYLTNKLELDENGISPDGLGITIEGPDENGLTAVRIDTEINNDGVSFNGNNDLSNVDTYIYLIDNFGNIIAGDALTDAYLRNPYNYNEKQTDLEAALEIYQEKYQ